MPIANTCSIGYPHDGRADNAAYRHDRRADNAANRHDRRADSLSHLLILNKVKRPIGNKPSTGLRACKSISFVIRGIDLSVYYSKVFHI